MSASTESVITSQISAMFAGATHFRRCKKENGRSGLLAVTQQLSDKQYIVCVGTKLAHIFVKYNIENNEFDLKPYLEHQSASSSSSSNVADGGTSTIDYLYRNVLAYQNTLARCSDRISLFRYLGMINETTSIW